MEIGDKVVIKATIESFSDSATQLNSDGFCFWATNRIVDQIEPEFVPRIMLVWDNYQPINKREQLVIGTFNDRYIVDSELNNNWTVWDNAEDIPEEPKIVSDEELLKTFQDWLESVKKQKNNQNS